jgi:hypothetical protein
MLSKVEDGRTKSWFELSLEFVAVRSRESTNPKIVRLDENG